MNKKIKILAWLLTCCLLLSACHSQETPTATSPTRAPVLPPHPELADRPAPTEPPTEPPTEASAEPEHSPLYIPDVSVENVITYFKEVSLDAEFSENGNPNLVQKWTVPINYYLHGSYTEEDITVINRLANWLNTVDGFPGIWQVDDSNAANLQIYFCTVDEITERMGENYVNMDGAVTFWYMNNEITKGIICIRHDIDQYLRNSVIQEEIYNGLGPVQDTLLRPDSIAYANFSQPQRLTDVDKLLIQLLYHPMIECGMNAEECEAVIRQLYY